MHKVALAWFVLHKSWHTTLFGTYYCVQVVRIENHSHMLQLRAKLRSLRFSSFFGPFADNVAYTWFVLYETWHTTLFGT